MRMLILLLTTSIATAALAADYPLPAGAQQAAEEVDRHSLEAPIRFLASDLLEGRGPATDADRLTQLYLATQMQAMGLEPGGPDGSWLQPFDIVGIHSQVPKSWSFRTRGGRTVTLDTWTEFIAASGVQRPRSAIENAEVVFAGYGIEAPEYKWNDYKGTDLKGKVLLMLNNDPDWDPKLFEGEKRLYYGRWTYKYESAARQGAAGAIIIHTVPSAGYPWQVVQTSWTGEQFELPAEGEPRIEVAAWVTEDAARQLVSAAGRDLDKLIASARNRNFRPVPLGITTSLALENNISGKQTANVLGLLRGSDRAGEVVVYTAHHDHLGIGEPDAEGDRIYNGALDNASGTAHLLAIARAFTALPERPSRSILFNFVGAEEQGLLGSEYYAKHPTFHPGKIAANLNFDGANIWGRTTDVAQVGFGKSPLDDVIRHFAALQGRTVKPEQFPDRGFYYRSDQFNFAKIGVPAIYLDTGAEFSGRPAGWGRQQIEAWEAKQYHQPSDELDASWNFDGMIDDARLGFFAGLAIAQMPEMPGWNPGDEFEAERRKALAAARAETRSMPADAFLARIAQHCNQAFAGKIVANEPPAPDDPFAGKPLVMHVRECGESEIRIPFHVGDDHSRTWVLTRTTSGLRLKHDHRHEDGTDDAVTMYGGDTATPGTEVRQAFPVDRHSIDLFRREGLTASVVNVWAMEIEPGRRFLYELARPGHGRLFQVEFDLTRPVPAPPAPW